MGGGVADGDGGVIGGVAGAALLPAAFEQYQLGLPQHGGEGGFSQLGGHSDKFRAAALFIGRGDLIRHGGGAGAGTLAVRKGVNFGETNFPGKLQRLLVVHFGFAGKAHHHIGGEGGSGKGLSHRFSHGAVLGGIVVTVHAAQGGIAAALQRKMELRAELAPTALRQAVNFLRSEEVGFDGAETDPLDAGGGGCRQDGIGEVQPPFPAVIGKIDAGEDDLTVTVPRKGEKLALQLRHGLAADGAARGGDDAIAAPVIAAILYFKKGAGAHAEIGGGAAFEILAFFVLRDADNALTVERERPHQLRQGGTVACPGDDIGLLHGGGLRRERLRVAAGEHHDGAGIFPTEAADGLAGLAVAFGGDGAAAHHIDIAAGGVPGDDIKAFGGKAGGKHLSFVLIDLAAKGIERDAHGEDLRGWVGRDWGEGGSGCRAAGPAAEPPQRAEPAETVRRTVWPAARCPCLLQSEKGVRSLTLLL